jgi:hypothetical protein
MVCFKEHDKKTIPAAQFLYEKHLFFHCGINFFLSLFNKDCFISVLTKK